MTTNYNNPSDKRRYSERWPLVSGKRLFSVIDERSSDGTEELLSVSHITGITPRSQKNVTMFKSESLVGYKKCAIGDIAANTMWTWQGAIGVSRFDGVISPAYNVYRQRNDSYNPRYLDMLLREKHLVDVYHSISTGIRPSRLRLYPEPFMTIAMPVPPREEQNQIVRYLDWQVSKINKLIATKKHEISALEENRQVLIDTLVLRSPHNTQTKSVSLSWDAPIPSTWNAYKFNQVFDFGKGLAITKANLLPSGIPVISYGQIHSKTNNGTSINDSLIRYVSDDYVSSSPKSLVHEGDFIFADTSEDFLGVGNCVYVDSDDTLFAGYHTVIARPKDNIKRRYLAYLFLSSAWRYSLRKQVNGVKVYSITQRILKNTCVILPPKEEQDEISNILDAQCARIDALINAIRTEIEHFHELRTRIISDVVTGQIDVRGIEIPDFEMVEEINESADEDDISEETEEEEE